MWEIVNFFLILLLLLIILIILITFVYFYYTIKSYIDDTLSKIGSSIPMFNSHEYTNIEYSEVDNKDLQDSKFNLNIAKLLCQINMSSYNIFGDFPSRLPENIKHVETIGDNCYIYKYKGLKKKVLIISYRGTKTIDDWLNDLDAVQTRMSGYSDDILIHRGFHRLWISTKDDLINFIKTKSEIDQSSILVTGHSLGCASALLSSLLLKKYCKDVKLYMFAPPRIGNHQLIKRLNESVPQNYAVINTPDLVTNYPLVTLPLPGDTLVYDNFSNKYVMDIQMGSVGLNHRLDIYMCGLVKDREKMEHCKNPIWEKFPVLTTLN